MIELAVTGNTLPEAYHSALLWLKNLGEDIPCPAYSTRCKELAMTIIVQNPLAEPRISRLMPGGPADLQQYCMEILDGVLDFRVGDGWDYTYHDRIAVQLPVAIKELQEDPNSRRACITVRLPEDIFMTDPPCLQHLQFFIRNGKLDLTVLFRSNDAVRACFMNAFALIELQRRVAEELGVEVGTYTHRANSFHAYEDNWALLDKSVDRINLGEDLTYDYAGDWDEQMQDAVPAINAKIEALRRKEVG